MASDLYLGYRNDGAAVPAKSSSNPRWPRCLQHVVRWRCAYGPRPEGWRCFRFDDARASLMRGINETENGYGILGDGGMQGIRAHRHARGHSAMWVWWFGRHGSDTRRHKL